MFPISLNLGFKLIPFYEGFYFLIAILTAALWALKRWRKAGLDEGAYELVLIMGLLGAIVGARLSHFLFWDLSLLKDDPGAILRFWEGGLSVTGGVVVGILGALWACSIRKVSFWSVMSTATPALLLGQAVGRVGCFLNGDAFGLPTNLPWGVHFKRYSLSLFDFQTLKRYSGPAWDWCFQHKLVKPNSRWTVAMHPTQLYECGLDLILLSLLLLWLKKTSGKKSGQGALIIATGGYAFIRFGLEFIRGDNGGPVALGMTSLQFTLLAVGLAGIALFALLNLRSRERA